MGTRVRETLRRPGLLALIASLMVAAVPFLLMDLLGDITEERALSERRECASVPAPCIVRATASLEYANSGTRRTGPYVSVRFEDGSAESIHVPRGHDAYLETWEGERIEVWRVEGDEVAVVVGGSRFDDPGAGLRGAVSDGFLAAFLLVLATAPAGDAWRFRRLGWCARIPDSPATAPVARWALWPLALPTIVLVSGASVGVAFLASGIGVAGVLGGRLWQRYRRVSGRVGKHERIY